MIKYKIFFSWFARNNAHNLIQNQDLSRCYLAPSSYLCPYPDFILCRRSIFVLSFCSIIRLFTIPSHISPDTVHPLFLWTYLLILFFLSSTYSSLSSFYSQIPYTSLATLSSSIIPYGAPYGIITQYLFKKIIKTISEELETYILCEILSNKNIFKVLKQKKKKKKSVPLVRPTEVIS